MSRSFKFFRKKDTSSNGIKTLLSMGSDEAGSFQQANKRSTMSKIALTASVSSPGIQSHRNLNCKHQMLIAEAIYDESIPLNTSSKLCNNLKETLEDNVCLSYFVQFLESKGTEFKSLIRCWIQIKCFRESFKECLDKNATHKFEQNDYANDANKIFQQYFNGDEFIFLGIKDKILEELKFNVNHNCINEDLFSSIENSIQNYLKENHFEAFLKSPYFCKYQLEILTSSSLKFVDILFNDSILFYFMEFIEQEGMKHYIDFLLMAENCRKVEFQKDDYRIIYDKFFSPKSSSFLKLSDTLNRQIEIEMNADNKNCFDKPMSILIQYFEKSYFKQFIQSATFIAFVNNSINSLHILDHTSGLSRSHRSNSEESDLTMSSCAHSSRSDRNESPQLFVRDFDGLWKRDNAGDLQMAHINQYGQLSTYFEPEPEKSRPTINFSKAAKKLGLNVQDEQEKTEMAWKVAQMIIDDVCNLTQPSTF